MVITDNETYSHAYLTANNEHHKVCMHLTWGAFRAIAKHCFKKFQTAEIDHMVDGPPISDAARKWLRGLNIKPGHANYKGKLVTYNITLDGTATPSPLKAVVQGNSVQ